MREKLIEILDESFAEQSYKRGLLTAPHTADFLIAHGVTIDPASLRPKGEWVQVICHVEFEDGFVDRLYECCSRCHMPNGRRLSNFCPNCGADMRGGNDG